jgi:phytoene dehydrogenase-like protein
VEKRNVLMKAIIIGSGMSGLTAAATLASAGVQVTVMEQFATPGGVTATLQEGGFGWDLGPLILEGFGPGDPATLILEDLGVLARVKTVREDRGLAFPDFALWKPEQYGGPYWRRDRLAEWFPDESQNLQRYYRFYDQVIDLMTLAKRAESAAGLNQALYKLRLALAFQPLRSKAGWTAQQLMDHYFRRPELKALFTAIVADFTTRPSEFPALGVPSIHLETAFDKRIPAEPGSRSARHGYFYIMGGCQTLVDAVLFALESAGGSLKTNTRVARIRVQDQRVTGVELEDGSFEAADLVVASGGARETFFGLLGREHLPADFCAKIDRTVFMESVLMVQLGIDFDPAPYQPAALCYYYGTYDLEGSLQRLRSGDFHGGKEGFLIYIPSRHSPDLAPPGCHAVTVYTVAPDQLREGSWELHGERLADQLLAEAERVLPGLRAHARVRVVLTPADFRRRVNQQHHSFGGTPPVIGNQSPHHRTPIEGLWFIGSQSESGGGVARVMVGGQKAALQMLGKL